MTLIAELSARADGFGRRRWRPVQLVTKLRGEVKFVAPGSLPNDGKVIADERPSG